MVIDLKKFFSFQIENDEGAVDSSGSSDIFTWVTFVQKFEANIWTGLNVLSCVRIMVWVVIKVSFIDWIGLSGKQIVLGGFKVCSSVPLEYKE